MRVFAFSLLLVCALTATYSQPPKDDAKGATKAYQIGRDNQRGTRDNPLVIESHSAEPSDAKAQKEQAEKDEHSHAESLIAIGTVVLAGITAILAVATIVLAIFTYRLWRETKTLREGADKQAKETTRQNTRQLSLAGRQLRLLTEQENIQRLQYFATHRPRLIVRQMGWDGPGHPGIDLDGHKDERREPITIRFQVVNQGGVGATISLINVTLVSISPSRSDPFPGVRPIDVRNNLAQHIEVPSGAAFDYHRSDVELGDRANWLNMLVHTPRVFVVGFVRYEDSLGTPYRTYFLRHLDREQGRFVPENDPEYEYQD